MTAPAAVGTYTYTVWADKGSPPGQASFTTLSITVAPPVTVPPTTVPPTTVPPTTVPPTTPPASIARIRSLSPDEAAIGATVTIKGTGFGRSGVVKFGSAIAKVSSWTSTKIVVKVPSISREEVDVTVTPLGGTASNGVEFDVKGQHGDDGGHGDSGHFVRLAGDFQS